MSITVLTPGFLTTVQDLGRIGAQRYGVTVGGAMDPFSLRVANLLVGNEEGDAGLEMTFTGPALRFHQDVLIAITGGDLPLHMDGRPLPRWRSVLVKAGGILRGSGMGKGSRAYLAVAGGISVPSVLGSKSTDLKAGIGGYQGRPLQEGDVLEIGKPSPWAESLMGSLHDFPFAAAHWQVSPKMFSFYRENPTLRVIRGGHFHLFDRASRQKFFREEFLVTPQSDRMGYRLTGPKVNMEKPYEMISEAVTVGTIQVPPDGNPILLMADRQTTGGYPKIAHVITADLPVVAQVKPGERIRFQEVSLEEAWTEYRLRERALKQLAEGIRAKGNG
ncbi:putative hydrolase subunit antagonist of KipI [[Clostridium] ultunense Esp]|nr:putative hydrolase subunit antagonist of KipI [[Clostridium] ultunense Esp]